MKEQLLEGRKPWNFGRKVMNWRPDLHPRGRDGRFINVFKKLLNMNIGEHRDLSDVVADAPDIQEATAWRTREGWELRTRATDGAYGTKISVTEVTDNNSIFDDVLQMINGQQGFPDLPNCPCGCGNKSADGLLPGHRERVRSRLNAASASGDRKATRALLDSPPSWYDDVPEIVEKPSGKEVDKLVQDLHRPEDRDFDVTDTPSKPVTDAPSMPGGLERTKNHRDRIASVIGPDAEEDWDFWNLNGHYEEQMRQYGLDLDEWDESVFAPSMHHEVDQEDRDRFKDRYDAARSKFFGHLGELDATREKHDIKTDLRDMDDVELQTLERLLDADRQDNKKDVDALDEPAEEAKEYRRQLDQHPSQSSILELVQEDLEERYAKGMADEGVTPDSTPEEKTQAEKRLRKKAFFGGDRRLVNYMDELAYERHLRDDIDGVREGPRRGPIERGGKADADRYDKEENTARRKEIQDKWTPLWVAPKPQKSDDDDYFDEDLAPVKEKSEDLKKMEDAVSKIVSADVDEIIAKKEKGEELSISDVMALAMADAKDKPDGKMDEIIDGIQTGIDADMDAENARHAAEMSDFKGSIRSRASSSPFPLNAKCRCGCNSPLPEGAKPGTLLPGHDAKQDRDLLGAAYRGDPAAVEYLGQSEAGRREFRRYAARQYSAAGGPELRVDGDSQFTDDELAYDPQRVPEGLPLDWEHAPLLDPGPGTPDQQANRLRVRRDRANSPTERLLLNAAIARLQEMPGILIKPSDKRPNVNIEMNRTVFRGFLEHIFGFEINDRVLNVPNWWDVIYTSDRPNGMVQIERYVDDGWLGYDDLGQLEDEVARWIKAVGGAKALRARAAAKLDGDYGVRPEHRLDIEDVLSREDQDYIESLRERGGKALELLDTLHDERVAKRLSRLDADMERNAIGYRERAILLNRKAAQGRHVLKEEDLRVVPQMSTLEADIDLISADRPIGKPLTLFVRNTGLENGAIIVQNMVNDPNAQVAPGSGNVAHVKLTEDFEIFEDVEDKLRAMGAVVGQSSLGYDGADMDGRKGRLENTQLIDRAENLSLSVWIDLGDGKLVEFFPQVTSRDRLHETGIGDGDDRLGHIDRAPEFESADGFSAQEQAVGFRFIPWSRRGTFEFTDMSVQEIEDFLQKVFPDLEHEREVAPRAIMGEEDGVPRIIQDGFADGSVVPNFGEYGSIHSFGGNIDDLIGALGTWGILSQSERAEFVRAATRNLRQGLFKPSPVVDVRTGKNVGMGIDMRTVGMSPSGDFASGIDGYVFTGWGNGIGYSRANFHFVIDPRHMMRNDLVLSDRDYGATDDRIVSYSKFHADYDGRMGESIPADKLQRVVEWSVLDAEYAEPMTIDDALDADYDGPIAMGDGPDLEQPLKGDAELNIPRGIPWSQMTDLHIVDYELYDAAVERGLASGKKQASATPANLKKLDDLVERLRIVAPNMRIHFYSDQGTSSGNYQKKLGVGASNKSSNLMLGLSSELAGNTGNLTQASIEDGTQYNLLASQLDKYAGKKVLDKMGLPGDTKLSSIDPSWSEYDDLTLDQMAELINNIAHYEKPGFYVDVTPIKMLDKKLDVDGKEYDMDGIDFKDRSNALGLLPAWYVLGGRDTEASYDEHLTDELVHNVLQKAYDDGVLPEAHPLWSMPHEERKKWLLGMPIIAFDMISQYPTVAEFDEEYYDF